MYFRETAFAGLIFFSCSSCKLSALLSFSRFRECVCVRLREIEMKVGSFFFLLPLRLRGIKHEEWSSIKNFNWTALFMISFAWSFLFTWKLKIEKFNVFRIICDSELFPLIEFLIDPAIACIYPFIKLNAEIQQLHSSSSNIVLLSNRNYAENLAARRCTLRQRRLVVW